MFKKIILLLENSQRYFIQQIKIDFHEHFWAFLGSFAGIGSIAFLQSKQYTTFSNLENLFLIGSFGASSVLVYGAIHSPFAQPRNLIGGHVISALVGVSIYKIMPNIIWLNAPLAVALSVILMQVTKTIHPPGGATALIAVIGSEKIKSMGYGFVLMPVLSGASILLVIALIVNNLNSRRRYPSKHTRNS